MPAVYKKAKLSNSRIYIEKKDKKTRYIFLLTQILLYVQCLKKRAWKILE